METKERMIQAAIQCFLENGYEKASISKITEVCNVTKGAFYHHFKNKDEIFIAAINALFYETEKWIREQVYSTDSFKDMLESLFNLPSYLSDSSYLSGFNPSHYMVFFDALKRFPELSDRIRQTYESLMHLYEERIKKAQHKGEIRSDMDSKAFAMHFYIVTEGLIFFDTFVGRMDRYEDDAAVLKENLWNLVKK